jgi:hypothetical protein
MSKIVWASSCMAFLFLPLPASAHGFGWGRASSMSYYCYPTPVCWDPCAIYVPPCPPGTLVTPGAPIPTQGAAPGPLAPPTAAPPSAGPLTPGKGQPEVSESRSFYESFSVRSQSTDKPATDRCAAGFWNLTGRDVTVSVEGQAHPVPRGKSLKLQVGRQFVWRVEGHEPQSEIVPKENSGVEIVLRRP